MDLGHEGTEKGPLAYRPLAPTMKPDEVTNDNYSRFQIKLKIPKTIDLKNCKVLWSKEKETAE